MDLSNLDSIRAFQQAIWGDGLTEDTTDWTEAFNKFGHGDGDDPSAEARTDNVVEALRALGYETGARFWGPHNYMIEELETPFLQEIEGISVGHDNPRDYLPKDLIEALDYAFPYSSPGHF